MPYNKLNEEEKQAY